MTVVVFSSAAASLCSSTVNPPTRDSCELTGCLSSPLVWIPNFFGFSQEEMERRQPSFLLPPWHGLMRTRACYFFLWDNTTRAHRRHRMPAAAILPFSCLQQCQVSDAIKAVKQLSCMEVTNTDSQPFHGKDWSKQVRQQSVPRPGDGRSLVSQGRWGFPRGEEETAYLFSKFVRLRWQPVKMRQDAQCWALVRSQHSYRQQKPHDRKRCLTGCPLSQPGESQRISGWKK